MAQRFFDLEDFDALGRGHARTQKPEIIAIRKNVSEKLKTLHREHLAHFLSAKGLHPHPNPNYWTNVFFPKWEANGEWVDYLRLGYGKEGRLVQQMAERAGFVKEVTTYGTNDHMAFHYVAQVQLGVTADYWWFNFYIDDKAWLEQINLLEKIKQPAHRRACEALLEDLMNQGYDLRIWSTNERGIPDDPRESPTEFLSDLALYRRHRLAVNVDIDKRFDPRGPENDLDLMPGVAMREYTALLPLYGFWAWHPITNHYIPRL